MASETVQLLSRIPRGAANIWAFALFNAVSFQVVLGSPMILYASSIGASATVLGILAAMAPALTVLQIPAAHFLERVGYRRFVLLGWSVRTLFIFIIAAIPLLVFLGETARLSLILVCLLFFNILRGISTAAWFPWVTSLIPEEVRGRFLAREQICVQVGSLGALLLASLILRGTPGAGQFAAAFFLSGLAALVSLWALKRIPEVDSPETMKTSGHPVPWRAIIGFPPFKNLMIFNLLVALALGSLPVFTVAFLKQNAGFSPSLILVLSCFTFVTSMGVAMVAGGWLDRFGSKPFLRLSLVLFAGITAAWAVLALPSERVPTSAVAALFLAMGLATALYTLANLRLVLGTMPPTGKNHFFAFYTVITSLGLGGAPFFWGVVLDVIGDDRLVVAGTSVGRFFLYFCGLLLCTLATLFYTGRLKERVPATIEPADASMAGGIRRFMRYWQR